MRDLVTTSTLLKDTRAFVVKVYLFRAKLETIMSQIVICFTN